MLHVANVDRVKLWREGMGLQPPLVICIGSITEVEKCIDMPFRNIGSREIDL